MKRILLIWMVLIPIFCFGQVITETSDDSLSFRKQLIYDETFGFDIPFYQFSPVKVSAEELSEPTYYAYSNHFTLSAVPDTENINSANLPTLDEFIKNQYIFNESKNLTTAHIQGNYFGLGGLNLVSENYNYHLEDFTTLTAGIYGTKYTIIKGFFNDVGINSNIKISLTDRLNMNLFGKYSINGKNIGISPLISPLFPQTNYGGSLGFKVNKNIEMMIGTVNEFDSFRRQWVIIPFIKPQIQIP